MTIELALFPQSTNVASATYDTETQTMTVEFLRGGVYKASPVPASMFDGLKRSPSPGSFYHRQLKDQFNWEKQ